MRLIDADALLRDMETLWDWPTVNGIQTDTALRQVMADIRNAPTVQGVKPVWHLSPRDPWFLCGACRKELPSSHFKYCPWCGRGIDWDALVEEAAQK